MRKFLIGAGLVVTVLCKAEAKTVSLLCETFASSRSSQISGFPGQDASYSTWSITIEKDDEGEVQKVFLDNDAKEFELKGDLLKFKSKFLYFLEINTRTGRARTTVTGFDTREQGACKVVSRQDKGLLD
jgi:hypothetical protein